MKKSEIAGLLKSCNIHPNKKLGQNFLFSEDMLDKIVRASGVSGGDSVLEIGPGLGTLTAKLLEKAGRVTAVEIDSGLVRCLRERFGDTENLTIIHADFLKTRINEEFSRVVSNLPYYSSSEILFTVAEVYRVPEMYVMLQREMAQRIVSRPGSRSYGALTVTLGYMYDSKILFNIERKYFYPEPEITSSFVSLRSRHGRSLSENENEMFHKIVKAAFWGRRKMLSTALSHSPHLSLGREMIYQAFSELGLDEKIRGESLSIEQFAGLAKIISGYIHEKN